VDGLFDMYRRVWASSLLEPTRGVEPKGRIAGQDAAIGDNFSQERRELLNTFTEPSIVVQCLCTDYVVT
jgi:hypothetical protein